MLWPEVSPTQEDVLRKLRGRAEGEKVEVGLVSLIIDGVISTQELIERLKPQMVFRDEWINPEALQRLYAIPSPRPEPGKGEELLAFFRFKDGPLTHSVVSDVEAVRIKRLLGLSKEDPVAMLWALLLYPNILEKDEGLACTWFGNRYYVYVSRLGAAPPVMSIVRTSNCVVSWGRASTCFCGRVLRPS